MPHQHHSVVMSLLWEQKNSVHILEYLLALLPSTSRKENQTQLRLFRGLGFSSLSSLFVLSLHMMYLLWPRPLSLLLVTVQKTCSQAEVLRSSLLILHSTGSGLTLAHTVTWTPKSVYEPLSHTHTHSLERLFPPCLLLLSFSFVYDGDDWGLHWCSVCVRHHDCSIMGCLVLVLWSTAACMLCRRFEALQGAAWRLINCLKSHHLTQF